MIGTFIAVSTDCSIREYRCIFMKLSSIDCYYVTRFAKRHLPHTSNSMNSEVHNSVPTKHISLKLFHPLSYVDAHLGD